MINLLGTTTKYLPIQNIKLKFYSWLPKTENPIKNI